MKKVLICLGVSALLFSFWGTVNANLIVNGGFETVDGRAGSVRGYALNNLGSSVPTWDVYGTLPGGWYSGANDAGIEVQYNGTLAGEGIAGANTGLYYVELDSNLPLDAPPGPTNSSMSQDIQFSVAFEYYLSFYYRPRTNDPDNLGDNSIEIFFDDPLRLGLPVFTVDGVKSEFTTGWQEFTVPLGYVLPGTRQLSFVAAGLDNTLGGLLDDVAVNPVPEPATMLLLGTGLVGLAGFRRKLRK